MPADRKGIAALYEDVWLLAEWGDCSPAGIAFYPYSYSRRFGYATDQRFDQTALPKSQLAARFGVVGRPIAEASSRFLVPGRYRQRFVVRPHVESRADKRFTVPHPRYRGLKLLFDG